MKICNHSGLPLWPLYLALGFFLFYIPHSAAQQNSVVRIKVNDGSGYGVVWEAKDQIVTVLQLVAGKKNIEVLWQNKMTTAHIEKIYKPSGLALLKLNTSLNISPLNSYSGNPPDKVSYFEVYDNQNTVKTKNSDLEEETKLSRLNSRMAGNTNLLNNILCYDNGVCYPQLSTEILKLKEPNIREDHSGSPVTYGKKVIGIIDCSPKRLNGSTCFWVIPSSDFKLLLQQETIKNDTMSSCRTPEPIDSIVTIQVDTSITMEDIEFEQVAQADNPLDLTYRDPSGDKLKLHFIKTQPFSFIWETLFSEDEEYIANVVHADSSSFSTEIESLYGRLLLQSIDFYTEIHTGISIAVPAGTPLELAKDGFGKLVTATSPDSLSSLSIYISACKKQAKAMKAFEDYKTMIYGQSIDTAAYQDNITDFSKDSLNPYYKQYFLQDSVNTYGNTISKFLGRATIANEDFLGITLNAPHWQNLNDPEERLYYYMLLICERLTNFPIH